MLTPQEEQQAQKIREILKHRLKNEAYRYYTPVGKVGEFIERMGSGDYISAALLAANGIGKTMAGAQILAHLFWPCDNPYFQSPIFKDWKYPKKVRIVSEPNTITETIIPMLKEVFPKGRYGIKRYETTKEGKRYESSWTTDTGWSITVMTYEMEPKEFESATVGLIWADEPPPEAIYHANMSRLRRGGVLFITATPLMGSAYMFDLYVANPNREKEGKLLVEAEIEDACEDHGVRGFYTHEQIERIISMYDPDEVAARAFGKFIHLSGLVFKKYSTQIHLIRPFAINEADFVVVHAFDPHPRVNDAFLWVAIDKNGTHFVIDELWVGDLSPGELSARIKKKEDGWRLIDRLIDPSAMIVNQHTGSSLNAEMHQNGLYYREGSKARTQAVRRIKDALDYQLSNGVFFKQPEVYVFDTCERLNYELTHWKWEEYKGKTAMSKGKKERPEDKDDHMIENLGRILIEGYQWTPLPPTHNTGYIREDLDPYS